MILKRKPPAKSRWFFYADGKPLTAKAFIKATV
jgi:hypothetical protein